MRLYVCMGILLSGLTLMSKEKSIVSQKSIVPQVLHPQFLYLFKISSPIACNQWCATYKGKELSFHNNLAIITEESAQVTFSLVITPELEGTRYGLRRLSNSACRWFDLTLRLRKDGTWKWHVVELPLSKAPLLLPEHAIVLYVSPALISKIQVPARTKYACDTSYEGGTCTFEMPTIMLKKHISQRELEEACVYSLCASLNIRKMHRQTKSICKMMNGICCSVYAPAD